MDHQGKKGVVVSKVDPDSAAARAELRPGLLILEVNRPEVQTINEFRKAVKQAGDKDNLLLYVQSQAGARFVVLKLDK